MKKKKDIVKPGEFRVNHARTGHFSYITEIVKEAENISAEFIGLTSQPYTRGEKNIKLHKNPNPKKIETTAYVRPKKDSVKLNEHTFGKKKKGWAFAEEDKPVINKIKKS